MMSNSFINNAKRQKMDFPQALLSGSPSMTVPMIPLDDGRLSDDEDSHKHKGGLNSKLSAEAKRSQHCEVEKRRREKMNRYMSELAQMIPACNAVPRKLDKLSILKMAVDHMKNLRGDPHCSSDYKPGFLTDEELKQLVVEAANGFMIIISCDKARVLFVSDTMSDVLHEPPENWLGSTLYDLLHPKDIQKVKEQLVSFDVEEALAASAKQNCTKSPLVMHPQSMNGLRRSFLCRVKRGGSSHPSPDSTSRESSILALSESDDFLDNSKKISHAYNQQYAVLHCTGFIRTLTPAERQSLQVEKDITGACLVAVARLQHFGDSAPQTSMSPKEKEFVARVGTDGRFTYIDPRVANILGYLPQDLTGQNSYDYFHPDDIQKMVQLHHESMKTRGPMPTVHYRFLSKNQKWVWLAMKAFSFINPFSQQIEYVVCTNVAHTKLVDSCESSPQDSSMSVSGSHDSIRQFNQSSSLTTVPSTTNNVPTTQENTSFPSDIVNILPELNSTDLQSWNGLLGIPPQANIYSSSSASSCPTSSSNMSVSSATSTQSTVVSQPADTTVQENAVTAQKIVDNYLKMNVAPPPRRDFNYSFPPGLFPGEVDLEGSAQAYHNLIDGLDSNIDLQQLLNQVDADPFKSSGIFNELDFDIFD